MDFHPKACNQIVVHQLLLHVHDQKVVHQWIKESVDHVTGNKTTPWSGQPIRRLVVFIANSPVYSAVSGLAACSLFSNKAHCCKEEPHTKRKKHETCVCVCVCVLSVCGLAKEAPCLSFNSHTARKHSFSRNVWSGFSATQPCDFRYSGNTRN